MSGRFQMPERNAGKGILNLCKGGGTQADTNECQAQHTDHLHYTPGVTQNSYQASIPSIHSYLASSSSATARAAAKLIPLARLLPAAVLVALLAAMLRIPAWKDRPPAVEEVKNPDLVAVPDL